MNVRNNDHNRIVVLTYYVINFIIIYFPFFLFSVLCFVVYYGTLLNQVAAWCSG